MVLRSGMKCVSYLMVFFNFIFMIAGLILIIVGAIAQTHQSKIGETSVAAVLVMVIGGVIFLLSFLGCCGALKENRCLLITFGIFMVVVLVATVVAFILALVYKSQVEDLWEKPMMNSLKAFDPSKKDTYIPFPWPDMQFDGKCCGVNNGSDWYQNKLFQNPDKLPSSCCGVKNDTAFCQPEDIKFRRGCLTVASETVENAVAIVGGIVAGVAVLELLSIIIAFLLANAIHKGYDVV